MIKFCEESVSQLKEVLERFVSFNFIFNQSSIKGRYRERYLINMFRFDCKQSPQFSEVNRVVNPSPSLSTFS